MADANWKQRLGIPIDYSSEEEEDEESKVEFRVKTPVPQAKVVADAVDIKKPPSRAPSYADELDEKFEQYGNTPPRTRIKIKNRDWDRKQKMDVAFKSRQVRTRVQRRNTMDCALLNEMFIDDDVKKPDKRAQALLRESEREAKNSLSVSSSAFYPNRYSCSFGNVERADSMPVSAVIRNCGVPTLIESCNRYMSVSSRPVGCRVSAPPTSFVLSDLKKDLTCSVKMQKRREFHETFANLIKLGSTEKQEGKVSHEDYTWQTELKDVIWLELQAWHADRTLEQQDKYLFSARQAVPELLDQILNYKFTPKYKRGSSVISVDSGLGSEPSAETPKCPNISTNCPGCLSMYCKDCNDQQTYALKEVEELLGRLEAAEALYPSSQAMGLAHPIYKSEAFVGRVKAMCLWYNITKHQRLKLAILGKILARLQGQNFQWPVQTSVNDSVNSAPDTDSEQSSAEMKLPPQPHTPKVTFEVGVQDGATNHNESFGSSNDSGSNELSASFNIESIDEYSRLMNSNDSRQTCFENVPCSANLYRKFIENVLKSRGLGKALSFLHRLHNVVLHKTQITLERPNTIDFENDLEYFDEEMPQIEPSIAIEELAELKRYGVWSPEARALCLPSYVPAFIFLSVIPLEVIHEYLRMRLETRPPKPNPLSLQQLMKELREGLTLASTHRERFSRHINTALGDSEEELDKYNNILDQFVTTIKKVFEVYMEYVDQWVLVASPEKLQKAALEKEWLFTKLICPMIPGMHVIAARQFCSIIRNLLRSVGDRLVSRSHELSEQIQVTTAHGEDKKWQLLTICREAQSLFTNERDRAIKILFFAKTFCRDIEQPDFHREHYEDYVNKQHSQDVACTAIYDLFKNLKKDVLDVRNKLTKIIEKLQEKCKPTNMIELEEQDKQAVLSRAREILHQGYKFGFEYNKDVLRLFEQKLVECKDDEYCLDLSLGIIALANRWMQFVTERCERGRGVRPRWASQGLEFLILACDPQNTRHLDDRQFDELKSKMDVCITHVIGIVTEPEKTKKKASPRARKSSATTAPIIIRSKTPTRSPMSAGILLTTENKLLQSQLSLKENQSTLSPTRAIDSPDFSSAASEASSITIVVPKVSSVYGPALRQVRVRDAVNQLDLELEQDLRDKNLIGQVKALNCKAKDQIRARTVNFRWHRGIKIGQGRFGKVYTAVNNTTGELMAMKEITIQPGENRSIKKVAEELEILEGISHIHLVKYYGVEIHREELLIFMELCSEGTLESLVELSGGLHEALTRRYTAQLLSGAAELHKHGIVHRDIKTANIFLTNGSNCIKLGDFGSAVKMQANITMPGEIQGYVGTQAYMAPEVFTKTNTVGHGRAADIWSIGCVVVEMASGKRPWYQFDSNFQIMFKVGMGETPEIPESLSQEGQEFLEHCLQHDPAKRMTSAELLQHNFCKVALEDCKCDESELKFRSLRRTKKL